MCSPRSNGNSAGPGELKRGRIGGMGLERGGVGVYGGNVGAGIVGITFLPRARCSERLTSFHIAYELLSALDAFLKTVR